MASRLSQRVEDIIAGRITLLSFPWPILNQATNALLPGSICMVCGDPGASKSLMVMQAFGHWFAEGYVTPMYQLEKELEFHQFRLLAQKMGMSELTSYEWMHAHPEEMRVVMEIQDDYLQEVSEYIYIRGHMMPTPDHLLQWAGERARDKVRAIIIDPVTMVVHETNRPQEEDTRLVCGLEQHMKQAGSSAILVTHPTKETGKSRPAMGLVAGGTGYVRFVDTVLWLESHDMKNGHVRNIGGTLPTEYNRTVHILKARNGSGKGLRIAMLFDVASLTFKELGVLVKAPAKSDGKE